LLAQNNHKLKQPATKKNVLFARFIALRYCNVHLPHSQRAEPLPPPPSLWLVPAPTQWRQRCWKLNLSFSVANCSDALVWAPGRKVSISSTLKPIRQDYNYLYLV